MTGYLGWHWKVKARPLCVHGAKYHNHVLLDSELLYAISIAPSFNHIIKLTYSLFILHFIYWPLFHWTIFIFQLKLTFFCRQFSWKILGYLNILMNAAVCLLCDNEPFIILSSRHDRFYNQLYNLFCSQSKLILLLLSASYECSLYRYHVWPQGHEPTNFAKWRTATTPFRVCVL